MKKKTIYFTLIQSINKKLFFYYANIKLMPLFIRLLSAFCFLFGLGLIVVSLYPFEPYQIRGEELTYSQMWSTGTAVRFLITGILYLVSGIGIFFRQPWTRYIILILLVILQVRRSIEVLNILVILRLTFLPILLIWYLFFKKSVKEYFFVK